VSSEAITRFRCFGGECAVLVCSAGRANESLVRTRRRMLEWHDQFSRFEPDSEISRLNRDPRESVPVSAVMLRLLRTATEAARITGGLVDPTLLVELRAAGYRCSLDTGGGPDTVALADALADALACAPPRRPATPRADTRWREIAVDTRAGTVTRPPGLELDLGGIAKGVFGDILAGGLAHLDSFAVDAAGDVRFGGRNTLPRTIAVTAPAGDGIVLHTFDLQEGAVATSGIGRRAWSDADGHPAHHLLDPGSGRPAFTGLVQVTALAATGAQAEVRAKAALLAGPQRARAWLTDGGALVADDGTVTVIERSARRQGTAAEVAA
jgi:thiamine biosynthesis lipoprotein